MTFPVIASRSTGQSGGVRQNHTIVLPPGSRPDDLIVIVFCARNAPTFTWPSGWNVAASQANGTSSKTEVVWRQLDGTEGIVRLGLGATAREAAWTAYRITGHNGAVEAVATTSSSANPDPPNLAPSWGSADTLWFIADCHLTGTGFVSTWPTNYTTDPHTTRWNNANGVAVHTSYRTNAASSENPGTFTLNASRVNETFTIAVQPGTRHGNPESSLYPKVRAWNEVVSGGTGTISVPLPTGWQPGDLLLAFFGDANQTIATPSGWTAFAGNPQGSGTGGGTSSFRMTGFWKKAVVGETDPITAADPGDHWVGCIIAITDTNPNSIGLWQDQEQGTTKITFDTTMSLTGVTTGGAKELIIAAVSNGLGNGAFGLDPLVSYDNWSHGLTEPMLLLDYGVDVGNGSTMTILSGKKATAGATGTVDATQFSAHGNAGFVIAIKYTETRPPRSFSVSM